MWKCKVCSSEELETLDWVDLKTGEHMNDGLGEFYCRSCENNVEVIYEETDDDDDTPWGDTSVE